MPGCSLLQASAAPACLLRDKIKYPIDVDTFKREGLGFRKTTGHVGTVCGSFSVRSAFRIWALKVCVCGPFFTETTATDRPFHDRGANQLCSHHTRRLGGHGPGPCFSEFSFLPSQEHCKHSCANIYTVASLGGPRSGPDEIEGGLRTRRVRSIPVVTR